jgi:hypothetical protein
MLSEYLGFLIIVRGRQTAGPLMVSLALFDLNLNKIFHGVDMLVNNKV